MSRHCRILAVLLVLASLTVFPDRTDSAPSPSVLRVSIAEDAFGVAHINTPGSAPQATRIRQASDMGAEWDRFPLYWPEIQETRNGPYNFAKYDAMVNAESTAGFEIQGILLGYPKWGGSDWQPDWERFVKETVGHFKGRIKVWEIWNEPDLKDDASGNGVFWTGTPAEYYQTLKTAYKAAKGVDPNVTILHAGLSFTWNNQDWFPRFLDAVAADSTAKANSYYFDALPIHQYGRPSTLFDLPVGYVGKPSFAGFHGLMQAKGFDKPIWANEVGVPVWNTGTGKNAPGRATMEESANFILQAFAYGFAAGVQRIFIFQMYDDGASSIDPSTKQPADYFGLVSNSGEPRPSYRAYQFAVDHFTGAQLVTRINLGRKEALGQKGVDAITFWGTPEGKVTLAWNNVGGKATDIWLPASGQKAMLYDRSGNGKEILPANGLYKLTLPGATNNNNFGCISGKCEPEDYIIGGDTQILIEPDKSVPAVAFQPIGPGSISPFTVSWAPVGNSGSGWTYDVQVQDTADGIWKDWILGTPQTTAVYGGRPEFPAQFEHTYVFRVQAKDRDGKVVGMGYPSFGLASTAVLGGQVSGGTSTVNGGTGGAANGTNTGAPAVTRLTFTTVDTQFSQFYDTHDGPRILGRAISRAVNPDGSGKNSTLEKGRLEDHSAQTTDSNWRFQYGLLVDELQQAKSTAPIGSDVSNLNYLGLADNAGADKRVPAPTSGYNGDILIRADGTAFIPFSADLKPAPGHNVPSYFVNYIRRNDLFPGGWLHDIGLPITEPIEVIVTKGADNNRKIVVQGFQRTILTYDAANPPDWQVERANVGTDYWKVFPAKMPQ